MLHFHLLTIITTKFYHKLFGLRTIFMTLSGQCTRYRATGPDRQIHRSFSVVLRVL